MQQRGEVSQSNSHKVSVYIRDNFLAEELINYLILVQEKQISFLPDLIIYQFIDTHPAPSFSVQNLATALDSKCCYSRTSPQIWLRIGQFTISEHNTNRYRNGNRWKTEGFLILSFHRSFGAQKMLHKSQFTSSNYMLSHEIRSGVLILWWH